VNNPSPSSVRCIFNIALSLLSETPSHGEGASKGWVLKEANMDYILDFEKLDKNSIPIVGGMPAWGR
jgi:hypothetical protein